MSSEVHAWEPDLPRRIAGQDVENRHGQYVSGNPVLGSRTIRVIGAIKQANESALRSRLSAYELALAHGGGANLYYYNDKYIVARCGRSAFTPTPGNALHYRFNIEFLCDDPFWYDASQTTDSETPASSPHNWTHNYAGTYLIYPVLNLTAAGGGGCTNPKFENTTISRSIQYDGTVAAGQTMEIDCAKMWMKVNSVKTALFTGTFNVWLAIGDNSMSFTYSGTAPASISVVYRKRYYAP